LSDSSLVLYQPEQEPVIVYDSPDRHYIAYKVDYWLMRVYDVNPGETIEVASGLSVTSIPVQAGIVNRDCREIRLCLEPHSTTRDNQVWPLHPPLGCPTLDATRPPRTHPHAI